MGSSSLFSFLVKATAPDGTKYDAGRRYELIVFVRQDSMKDAKVDAREALSKARWSFPEVLEAAQVDGKMVLSKFEKLNLADAVKTAAKQGHSIVVFPDSAAL